MEKMYQVIQAHRRASSAILFGFFVFITCFGFPVYRFGESWSASAAALNLFVCLVGYYDIGLGLGGLFPRKRLPFLLCLTGLLTGLGLGCRFLLEFGEVSNTYNFTLPNLLLHLAVSVVYCSLVWLFSVKRQGAEAG